MLVAKAYYVSGLACLLLNLLVIPASAGQLSSSTTVQANIDILKESKSCPRCDLSGADLNRIDLAGANLEGADLSRTKMYLTDLSGANLKNANLQEAEFGGADLANADLRGANLTGSTFAGAYMSGARFDGEMISTTPYADDNISDVQEKVYVEDTVRPKTLPATQEMAIGRRRDFEETPPVLRVTTEKIPGDNAVPDEGVAVPEESVAAPDVKTVPAMNHVQIQEEEEVAEVEEIVAVSQPDKTEEAAVQEESMERVKAAPAQLIAAETAEDTPTESDIEQMESDQEGADALLSPEFSPEVLQNMEILLDENKCYGCNLTGVNLRGENLDSADLEGADLTGAVLSKADLEDANLKGANLTNADLSGADLSGADMYRANLTGANLTGANLENALLDDTEMVGAKGYQPPMPLMESK